MNMKKIVKVSCTIAALLCLSTSTISAYANSTQESQPYYEQNTENTAEVTPEVTQDPNFVILTPDPVTPEPTIDPVEALRQQQEEDNSETHGLLSEIKELVGGLFNKSDDGGGSSSNSGSSTSVGNNGNGYANIPADFENMFESMMNIQIPTPQPEPTPVPTPTPVPKLTATDGNGYIIEDSQQLANGKEFLTMASKDGTEFYMVIDRDKDNEVYMLNKVDTTDLIPFASPTPAASIIPTNTPTATPTVQPTATPQAGVPKEKSGVGAGTIVFMLIIALGIGAGVYFFKNRGNEAEFEETDTDDEYTDDTENDDDYEILDEEEELDEAEEDDEE